MDKWIYNKCGTCKQNEVCGPLHISQSILFTYSLVQIVREIFLSIFVTIQPPPNQLANIDFDVIGTSDY